MTRVFNYLDVPRVHGSGTSANPYWIREADGSRYDGKVYVKRIKKPTGYSAFSIVFKDDSGRWFDNAGMPIQNLNVMEIDE